MVGSSVLSFIVSYSWGKSCWRKKIMSNKNV